MTPMTKFPAISNEAYPVKITPRDRVQFARALGGGYYVQVLMAPASSDDLWDTVELPVIYSSLPQVEAKVAAVKARGEIDLRFWTWTPSWASPWSFMHKAPIAKIQEAPLRDVAQFAD
jgi:hypothetical protein